MSKINLLSGKPILVTCGLPYVNGPCHIGHLRSYVPADIFVRFLRKMGEEVVFICGSDTHGTPIVINAEKQGVKPEELVKKYHEHFKNIFSKMEVDFDRYGSTDDPTNHKRTQSIIKNLVDHGYVYEKELDLAYCENCKMFLPDRYVEGICPYCGEKARGDECDQGCGSYLQPGEILDPVCMICGNPASYRKRKHYFFKLSEFQDFLKSFLNDVDGTDNAINYAKEWADNELKDWCITRDLNWGVKFPGRDDLVVYVWVDAPIGYIAFTEEWAKENNRDWEVFWLKKDTGKIIHFIGMDIVYHHCILWPALLKAANYNIPSAIIASGMVKIDNKKFSKSRGYVIWVDDDYLDKGFHPDLLRYYLCDYTSHTKELNFSWSVFQEKINGEIIASLGNFMYRTLLFVYKNFGEVPDGNIDPEIMTRIYEAKDRYIEAMLSYEFKKAIDEAMALSDFGNGYFQSNQPWKMVKDDKNRAKDVLKGCVQLIKALIILLEPVMPGKMGEARDMINLPEEETLIKDITREIKSGQKINKPSILFEKIEDEKITEMDEILNKRLSVAEKPDGTRRI